MKYACVFLLAGLGAAIPAQAQVFAPQNFVLDSFYFGDGTVALDFAPSGRIFVTEKRGRVLTMAPNGSGGYLGATELYSLVGQVNFNQESGLLGLAVDPDYNSNRYVYLFFTSFSDQRLVRITTNAAGDAVVPGSYTVILSGLPRQFDIHNAGNIRFRPGEPNAIYISLGDDSDPGAVQNTAFYVGKMLKVDKATGAGLPSNPYYDGNVNSVPSRLWAVGFRNPFRFTFHPSPPGPLANIMYSSENGDATDRLSWIRPGSNGSWNTQGDTGGFLNPPDSNHRVVITQTAFGGPTSVIGIAIAPSGPFTDPANPQDPVLYNSNWVLPIGGSVSRWRLTGSDQDTAVAVSTDNGQRFLTGHSATHLEFGPDGALYYTQTGPGEALGGFYAVGRIRYVGGQPPVAAFDTNPDPPTGLAPLTVQFTDQSNDPDGTVVQYAWTFGDGGTSTQPSPSYTYTTPGVYTAQLQVTDNQGLVDVTTRSVTVIQSTQIRLRGQIRDGRSFTAGNLATATALRLYQEDGQPLAVAQGTGPNQNEIPVPAGGTFDVTVGASLSGAGLVVSAGEDRLDLQAAFRGLPVATGVSNVTFDLAFVLSDAALRGRVEDTQGENVTTDIGVSIVQEGMIYAVVGGRDYLPGSGLPPTGLPHRVDSDAWGYYYVPIRSATAGVLFIFDAVGDTQTNVYIPAQVSFTIPVGQVVEQTIVVGLQSGGASCDDLSGVAVTPNVDYPTQIQPIWDGACSGCHNPGASNNGALDLTGNSWGNLVNVLSNQVPNLPLVTPSSPGQSYLVEKINCANPQVGTRMRPADPMPLPDQGLIRDWIVQGALPNAVVIVPDAGVVDTGVIDAGFEPDAMVPPDAGFEPDATVVPIPDAGFEPDAMVPPDAGFEPDATVVPIPDAGFEPDATIVPDAGFEPDAMVPDPDAGLEPDAMVVPDPDGGVELDAAVPPDGGAPVDGGPVDAEVQEDAGVVMDAGSPDVGQPQPDAGVSTNPDAGQTNDDDQGLTGGCNCSADGSEPANGSAWWGLAGLGLWFGRRRLTRAVVRSKS